MNKAELVKAVSEETGMTLGDANGAVSAAFELITREVQNREEVSIAGFGKFTAHDRPARAARNPKTGEAIQVPARTVPKFSPAKSFKDMM